MKARVKATGEIIDVVLANDGWVRTTEPKSYIEDLDEIEILGYTTEEVMERIEMAYERWSQDINWEQRRYEIAKSVIATLELGPSKAAETAVVYADALIERLKRE